MKKTLLLVSMLILSVGIFCGCKSQGPVEEQSTDEAMYNLSGEELVEAEEEIFVGTLPFIYGDGTSFGYTVESLEELLSNTNGKYLWFEHPVYEHSTNGEHNVYSVSEVKFWENVAREHGLWGEMPTTTTIYNETETIRRLAELHLINMTRDGRDTSDGLFNTYYLSYWMDSAWQCLDGAVVNTNESYEYFEEHGLKLAITNPKATTILSGAGNMSRFPYYGVLVTAEVGKVQNTGQFQDLDWIPQNGRNQVTFMVFFDYGNQKDVGKRSNIVDIAVLNYKAIEE